MKKILYLTDLYYQAKGRNYYEEDLFLSGILKDHFDIVLCNPKNSSSFENDVDLIIFRNTGSVLNFKEVYDSFRERVKTNNLKTFNDFTGKADMCGKQYLLDLTLEGYPVIPTIDDIENIGLLPETDTYVIKPKEGADSIGLEFLTEEELIKRDLNNDILIKSPIIIPISCHLSFFGFFQKIIQHSIENIFLFSFPLDITNFNPTVQIRKLIEIIPYFLITFQCF